MERTRRRLLGVSATTALGGCATVGDRPPGLFSIGLVNVSDATADVDVTAWKDGEQLYESPFELSDDPAKGVRDVTRPWMLDCVPYEVEFTAVWNDQRVTKRSTDAPDGAGCYGVTANVWPDRFAVKEHDTEGCERDRNRS